MKRKIHSVVLLTIFFIGAAFTAKAQTLDTTRRAAFKLQIAASEQHQFTADIPASPYFLKPKALQLYCPETLFVECEVRADSIYAMRVVRENLDPDRTITVNFSQNADNRKEIKSILVVTNPFPRKLVYQALMATPTNNRWTRTSILPIEPRLQNFEFWPHAIVSLILDRWKLE